MVGVAVLMGVEMAVVVVVVVLHETVMAVFNCAIVACSVSGLSSNIFRELQSHLTWK